MVRKFKNGAESQKLYTDSIIDKLENIEEKSSMLHKMQSRMSGKEGGIT